MLKKMNTAAYHHLWVLIDKALASGLWPDIQDVKDYAAGFWYNHDLLEFYRLFHGCQSRDANIAAWYLLDLDHFIREVTNFDEEHSA